ncbi:MAG: cytochrome c3 family protein, partial [Desulfuromonadales bacterium]|nr:cytochrome c3 family protein [Desulfuromonadales bacterium]
TGGNDGSNSTPYIHNTLNLFDGGAEYGFSGIEVDTLAGGTFKYVISNDNKGHNVVGIATPDSTLFTPPGYDGGLPAADGSTPGSGGSWNNEQITCAGTYGCHGSHDKDSNVDAIRGAHHLGANGAVTPGSDHSPAAGYRMLVGIDGFEDSDWEYRPTSSAHNQYKGIDSPGQTTDTSTISYLCAECHGTFHQSSGIASPWLRHPTDYALSNTAANSEYREYGGIGHDYLPATPLAAAEISSVVTTINFTSSDSVVNCLSCHRAHGSPYYKAMRWGYAESSGGGLCSNCHTSKN